MKLSELLRKEIVNIYDGARLGTLGESEIVINAETGEIDSIILPRKGSLISIFRDKGKLEIPWESVKKVGDEIIIVDLSKGQDRVRGLI